MPTAEVDGRAYSMEEPTRWKRLLDGRGYSMEEAGSFVVGIGWISFQPAA
jgi:hypothetical protein